jgi:hypothetical protein
MSVVTYVETSSLFRHFGVNYIQKHENICKICENLQIYLLRGVSAKHRPISDRISHKHAVQKRTFKVLTFHDRTGTTAIPGYAFGEKKLLPSHVSEIITEISLLCSALRL